MLAQPLHDRWLKESPDMRRAVILCSTASFISAFLGTVLAATLVVPSVVSAQQTGAHPDQGFSVFGGDGTQRVRIGTGPGYWAGLRVLSPDGSVPRAEIATGGNPLQGG